MFGKNKTGGWHSITIDKINVYSYQTMTIIKTTYVRFKKQK